MNMDLASALVKTLPRGSDRLFNPWTDRCPHDTVLNGPEERLKRLAQHLSCPANLILVGEAPGYQGARYSGVAFSSEKLLIDGAIPRVDAAPGRLTDRWLPFSEPSATIVWKNLYKLGLAENTVLWNALQLHPFKAGEPMSNRTPTPVELEIGHAAIRILQEAFPQARWVAIGKKAEGLLYAAGVNPAGAVRHPANGGATLFAEGLAALTAWEE
ncbi:TPA: hypothetical protein L4559_005114 [Pseudomonas aeruginosa]|nr:hypothetical protein [Pseudomonas aeruginosa]